MKKQTVISQEIQEQICKYTGLAFDKGTEAFTGRTEGYFCQLFASAQVQVLTVAARIPKGAELTEETVNAQLRKLTETEQAIRNCEFRNYTVSVLIACNIADASSVAARVMREVGNLCAQLGLITCCTQCGTDSGRNVALGKTVRTLCKDCEELCADRLKSEAKGQPNLLYGLLAAVVGGIVSFFAIYLLWQINIIIYCVAVAGLLTAAGIGSKLEKALTRSTLILGTIFCLIGSCLASFYTMGEDLADAFTVSRELTYTAEYETFCTEQLERLELVQTMTDAELKEAFSDYSAEEIAELKTNLPTLIESMELDLEDAAFVKAHMTPISCIRDIRTVAEWSSSPSEVWSGILKNLVPSVLSLLLIGVISASGAGMKNSECRELE